MDIFKEIFATIRHYVKKNLSLRQILVILILSSMVLLYIDIIPNNYVIIVKIILILTLITLFIKCIEPIMKFITDLISSFKLDDIESLTPDAQKILMFFYSETFITTKEDFKISLNEKHPAIQFLKKRGFIEQYYCPVRFTDTNYLYYNDFKLTDQAKHKLNYSKKFKPFYKQFMSSEQNRQEILHLIQRISHPNEYDNIMFNRHYIIS